MRALLAFIAKIEVALSYAAAVILFAVMAIVATDVAMRYLFTAPFSWSYDLISLYLTLALFYFCLSRTFTVHAHVGVDILHYRVPPKVRRLFELITCLISAPIFIEIAFACARRAAAAYSGNDVMGGVIAWPTWAFIALVPLGAGLLSLRLILNGIAHAIALFDGPELIPLPPLARSDEAIEQAAFE